MFFKKLGSFIFDTKFMEYLGLAALSTFSYLLGFAYLTKAISIFLGVCLIVEVSGIFLKNISSLLGAVPKVAQEVTQTTEEARKSLEHIADLTEKLNTDVPKVISKLSGTITEMGTSSIEEISALRITLNQNLMSLTRHFEHETTAIRKEIIDVTKQNIVNLGKSLDRKYAQPLLQSSFMFGLNGALYLVASEYIQYTIIPSLLMMTFYYQRDNLQGLYSIFAKEEAWQVLLGLFMFAMLYTYQPNLDVAIRTQNLCYIIYLGFSLALLFQYSFNLSDPNDVYIRHPAPLPPLITNSGERSPVIAVIEGSESACRLDHEELEEEKRSSSPTNFRN